MVLFIETVDFCVGGRQKLIKETSVCVCEILFSPQKETLQRYHVQNTHQQCEWGLWWGLECNVVCVGGRLVRMCRELLR